jgi:hypothetical protein
MIAEGATPAERDVAFEELRWAATSLHHERARADQADNDSLKDGDL